MRHRFSSVSLAPLALCIGLGLPACSSDAPPPGGDPDASDPGGDPDAAIPPGSLQVQWGPLTVQPGVEEIRCVNVRLGNATPLRINQIHNLLGSASHHYIVYKAPSTAEEHSDPRPCESVQNLVDPTNGVPLMITQRFEELLALPQGIAFEFEADQMLRLELHYINASDTPQDVLVTTTLSPIPDAEFENAADFVFIGNPDISLSPMSSATLGPSYFPMPPEFAGTQFFGMTGHQHQWGTDVFVAVAESEQGPDTPVYDLPDFNWDEPETVYYDPAFELPAGGGFRFTCEWNNMSARTVGFGENVDDEMCFFWAYYYPSRGAKVCFHTDQTGSPINICCPDHPLCAIVGDFI